MSLQHRYFEFPDIYYILDLLVLSGDNTLHNEASAIENLSNEILAKFEAGKNDEARNAYDRVMTRCLACHRIIRKW